KLHAEGRQFGDQNTRPRRADRVAHACALERRRLRSHRQWQNAPFQAQYRRMAGLRRSRYANQESQIARDLETRNPGKASLIQNLSPPGFLASKFSFFGE